MDDSNRFVEVVTSSDDNSSASIKVLKVAQTISEESAGLFPLNKGEIVVIEDADIMPTHTPAYILPFLVGEILTNLTERESQIRHAKLEVQILRPCDLISIKKKIVNCKWMGNLNDRRLKRTTVKRVSVKLVVELTPKGKTLTATSVDAIAAAYPSTTQQK